MRSLTEETVVSLTKTPADGITHLHLDSQAFNSLSPSLQSLSQSLVSLSLCHNGLRSVEQLGECCGLWTLNLSGNMIEDLSGLERLQALGGLDLSFNRLGLEKLRPLQHVEIVHLCVEVRRCTIRHAESK